MLVSHYASVPRAMEHTDLLIGLFILGCHLTGAVIGYYLPDLIVQALGLAWSNDGLAFGAKVFGAEGGTGTRTMISWRRTDAGS